jgi:hypothetical protein
MTLPRHRGGLGLMNPIVQQRALQLRWLLPLLRYHPLEYEFWYCKTMSSSIVLPLLADYLMYHLDSTHGPSTRLLSKDYRLAFLFPSIRSVSLKDHNSPFKLLFDVMDMLSKDFSKTADI